DRPAVDVEVDPGLVHLGCLCPDPDVVPVEGDVERADGDGPSFDPADLGRQATGEIVPAGGDPHQDHGLGALVALDDLVRDAGDGPAHLGLVHQARGGHQAPPEAAE